MDESNLFGLVTRDKVFYETKDNKFKQVCVKTLEESEFCTEKGKRLKKLNEKMKDALYDEEQDALFGMVKEDLIAEDPKFYTVPLIQNVIRSSTAEGAMQSEVLGSFHKVFCTLHGKRAILTTRILAHSYFPDYIYYFDIFTQRTFYLPIDPLKHFVGFFTQVEEDPRKISYILLN